MDGHRCATDTMDMVPTVASTLCAEKVLDLALDDFNEVFWRHARVVLFDSAAIQANPFDFLICFGIHVMK